MAALNKTEDSGCQLGTAQSVVLVGIVPAQQIDRISAPVKHSRCLATGVIVLSVRPHTHTSKQYNPNSLSNQIYTDVKLRFSFYGLLL